AGRGADDGVLRARSRLARAWLTTHESGEAERRQLDLPITLAVQARFSMPQNAPHFVDAVLRGRPVSSHRIETTLDLRLQRMIERQIQRYLQQHGDRGIRNVTA